MKFLSVLVLAAAGTAVAKGSKNATSTKAQCAEVKKFTSLTALAANQTKLDEKTKGNATKADAIKAKASDAATKLTALQSNATLMTACDAIFSVETTQRDCAKMVEMQKMAALVANQTALDAKTKDNTTKADALKAKVSDNAAKLTALESNTTLTSFCSVEETKATCNAMKAMTKEVALAGNTTALDAKFKGNATKIAKFQAQVDKVKAKLDAMQSNTTLTDACNSLKSTTGASTSSSGSSGATSGAATIKPVAGSISLVAFILAGVLLL